jgi:hypothetical protein
VPANRVPGEGQSNGGQRRNRAESTGDLNRRAEHVDEDGDSKLAACHTEHARDPANRHAAQASEHECGRRIPAYVEVGEMEEGLVDEQQANRTR